MTDIAIPDSGVIIKPATKPHCYAMPFGMAFVSKNNEQVCCFVTCRDYLHDIIRTYVNEKKRYRGDGHPYYPELGHPDIYMDELRLLLLIENSFDDKYVVQAIKLINAFEKYGRMRQTTIEKVKIKGDKTQCKYFLLKGSKEYMHNPHLLSALTLTMRFCIANGKTIDVKNEYSLVKSYNHSTMVHDNYLMTDCHKYLHYVFKRRKYLFKGISLKELFPLRHDFSFHSSGGIQMLCRTKTLNTEVNVRMQKLKQKVDNK